MNGCIKEDIIFSFQVAPNEECHLTTSSKVPQFVPSLFEKEATVISVSSCVELEGQGLMCDLWVSSQPIYSLKLNVKLLSHLSGK